MKLLLVVILVVVATISNGVLEECSFADVTVSDTKPVDLTPALTTLSESKTEESYQPYLYQYSYVQLGPRFQGVIVKAEWLYTTSAMFFKAHDSCFSGDSTSTQWWQVKVGCGYHENDERYWYYMHAGDCYWECTRRHISQLYFPRIIHVMGIGASRWRRTLPPDTCTVKNFTWPNLHVDRACRNPSPAATTSTTSSTAIPTMEIVVGVLVLVVLFLVVALVLVVRKKFHLRDTPPSAGVVAFHTQPSSQTPTAGPTSTSPHHHFPTTSDDPEEGIYDECNYIQGLTPPVPRPRGMTRRADSSLYDDVARMEPNMDDLYMKIQE